LAGAALGAAGFAAAVEAAGFAAAFLVVAIMVSRKMVMNPLLDRANGLGPIKIYLLVAYCR
jgi:hypothetical protein